MADLVNVIPASTQQQQQENRDNNFTNMCNINPNYCKDSPPPTTTAVMRLLDLAVEDKDKDSDHDDHNNDDDLVVNLFDAAMDAFRVDLLINIPNQALVVGLNSCGSDHHYRQLAPLKELDVIQLVLCKNTCYQMGGLGKTTILKVATATDRFMRLIRGRGPHKVTKTIVQSCLMSVKELTTAATRDHHATSLLITEDSTVLHKKESMDISNVVPNSVKNIDMEAGATRGYELTNQIINPYDEFGDRRQPIWSSDIGTIKSIIRSSHALLLIATLLTTLTYQVPFHLFGTTTKEGYVHNYKTKQDSILYRSFILLNSTTFIASVGLTLFLLQKFPLKPWTQISVSALFGSYMFAIKAISPNEVITLLFISMALLLLAVVGKLGGFAR